MEGIVAVGDVHRLLGTPKREVAAPDSTMPSEMVTATADEVLFGKEGPEPVERNHVSIVVRPVAPQYDAEVFPEPRSVVLNHVGRSVEPVRDLVREKEVVASLQGCASVEDEVRHRYRLDS